MIDGKVYIGQTVNIKERYRQHKIIAESKPTSKTYKKYKNLKLYNAMRKHGIENFNFSQFDIIKYGKNAANEEEKRLIKQFNSHGKDSNGYNNTIGGASDCGVNHSCYAKIQSKTSNEKRRKTMLGKNTGKRSVEICRNISKGLPKRVGKKHPSSQWWEITLNDNTVVKICGLKQWCKENGYSYMSLWRISKGKQNHHKNIKKVEKISKPN